jgi:two-component system OmpR family sensor kinase
MPGTVLVLFTVQQFQEKGAAALLFGTAATLPFHFVARNLFASSHAQYETEREEDRQRQAVMLASQASMILHEVVHQIGALNLLLHLPEGSSGSALGEARSHVRQLERTIENFRLSLRRHEMERQLVQVDGLVEQALAACSVEDHGPVAVKYEEGAAKCDVFGDPFLLSSALGNVLRNALEASPTDSPVELHVARRDRAAVAISVRDRGRGIDRADRERVFEPSFSTKGSGLGLGLHLAREIVRSHGGRVSMGETAGGGTTVTVVLPTILKRSS